MNELKGKTISVIISDTTAMECELLRLAFARARRQIDVIASCCSSDELIRATETTPADVILISSDLQDGPTAGLLALREIRRRHPQLANIVMLRSRKRELVIDAFRTGARGVFIRSDSFDLLCKCVRSVCEGQVWVGNSEVEEILEVLSTSVPLRIFNADGDDLLTPRQKQLVQLVAEGLSNREISERLNLSQHTIKNYLFRIFDKVGVANRAELIIYALSRYEHTEPTSFPAPSPQRKKASA